MATSHSQLWQAACEGKMICARCSDVLSIAPRSLTKCAAHIPIHSMRAMVLTGPRQSLRETDLPTPKPRAGQVLLRVRACAVCRTDLHVVDGELTQPKLPLVPGHEIVGEIVERGEGAERFAVGTRVGVPWLGWTCGECRFCRSGRENLCEQARFTGYTPGRWLRGIRAGGRAFLFPAAGALFRRTRQTELAFALHRRGGNAHRRYRAGSWQCHLRCHRCSSALAANGAERVENPGRCVQGGLGPLRFALARLRQECPLSRFGFEFGA